MSDDKIAEIRWRHQLDTRHDQLNYPAFWESRCLETHDDRATLLAEVERLREALQSIAGNTCCDSCQEAARVARKALALENNKLAAHADTLAALDAAAAKTDKEDGR